MRSVLEMSEAIKRVRILGIPVDHVDMRSALDFVDKAIRDDKRRQYVFAVNPEKVCVLKRDNTLRKLFEDAALLLPDGIGVVLAMRWLHGLSARRVPGSELMPNICKLSAEKGYRVFVYGSKEHVNKGAVEKLNQLYPGIHIVGRCNGYIGNDRMTELVQEINRSWANILFIALGSPKQEMWIQEYLPALNVNVCQGIGGTLDTITGDMKRAPELFLKTGLEWLYRLITDPRRIRRQITLPVFAMQVALEKFRVSWKIAGRN